MPSDADGSHPLLAEMEQAACSGRAGQLLQKFGLLQLRHRPLHQLSTGEGRKLMVVSSLLSSSRLLVLVGSTPPLM